MFFKSPFSHRIPSQTRFLHRFCLHQDWCLCILTLGFWESLSFRDGCNLVPTGSSRDFHPAHFKWFFPQPFSSRLRPWRLCPQHFVCGRWLDRRGYVTCHTCPLPKRANLNVEWNKSLGVCVCIPIRKGICNSHCDYWNFSKGSIRLCTSRCGNEIKKRRGVTRINQLNFPDVSRWLCYTKNFSFFLHFLVLFWWCRMSLLLKSAHISAITVVGLSGTLEDSGCLIAWLY